MTPLELFISLRLQQWSFWLEESRLKFRAPEDALTETILPQIRQYKSDLLEVLNSQPHQLEVYPLTYGQRALWYLWKLAPESSAYNQSIPLQTPTGSHYQNWARSFEVLLQRHPILTTRFPFHKESPIQQRTSPNEIDCQWIDLSQLDEPAQKNATRQAHETPFDLEATAAVRFKVFSENGTTPSLLLITMHHIICDGWSVEIIRKELQEIHQTLAKGKQPSTTPARYSYFDHACEEQALLNSSSRENQLTFWKNHLADAPSPISLPSQDNPRPPTLTFEGSSVQSLVPTDIHKRLSEIAREENITEFVLFLSVFMYQLHHYSGRNDLLIGSFSAGRGRAEYASTVGYFVNPIVIRSEKHEAAQNFREWLRASAQQTQNALEHGSAPFPWLVEQLQPERQPNRSPFFDITFNFLSRKMVSNLQENSDQSQHLQAVEFRQADGKFDLTLTLLEDGGKLNATFGYNCHLFEASTVEGFAADFQMLLQTFTNEPNTRLNNINDWQQIGSAPSVCPTPVITGRELPLASGEHFHHLFEKKVTHSKDSLAFSDGTYHLTYDELNRAADTLAQRLNERGVERNNVVAIANASSAAALTAILAVHKIGATYLPLDPAHYPADLLKYMVSTANAIRILTDPQPPEDIKSLDLPLESFTVESLLAKPTSGVPPQAVAPEDTAYIIFTSGSTGRPKGVMVSHRSVSNYIQSMLGDLAIQPTSRFALVSTLAADLGNTMLFLSLASGGTLYIMPETARLDPSAFTEFMQSNQIDYLKIVPSHWRTLLQAKATPEIFPKQSLILGGEGTDCSWVRDLTSIAPDCQIFNHYGPTEATIGVLTHSLNGPQIEGSPATLPLSRCVANSSIYILNTDLSSVAAEEVGELFISGACLSNGYIGKTQATSSNFLKLPGSTNQIIYKTGDLARKLPNGSIEILGRSDRQIQLRGFRIEPVQVETALQQSDQVKRCIATVHKSGSELAQLIAFVVPEASTMPTQDVQQALHSWAKEQLPEHMIPGHIHLVDTIPLTPNGKADIARLLKEIGSAQSTQKALPSTPAEHTLQQIWIETLGLTEIGIHDNFFEIGGHSLLAVKLLAKVEERFETKLSLQQLLTNTTIHQQAQSLAKIGTYIDRTLLPLIPNAPGQIIVCIPGAGGSVLYYNELARQLQPDYALWGLQGTGLSSKHTDETSIEAAATFYLQELKEAPFAGKPFTLVGHSYGGLVAYEMARQLGTDAPQTIDGLGIIDNPAPSAMQARGYENWDHAKWLLHIATRMQKLYQVDLQLQLEELRLLSDEQQVEKIHSHLVDHKVLPELISAQAFGKYIEVYRNNANASMRYQPEPLSIDLPITLFKAEEFDTDLGQMSSSNEASLEWQNYSPAIVEIVNIPGTHLSMMTDPNVPYLASAIRSQKLNQTKLVH